MNFTTSSQVKVADYTATFNSENKKRVFLDAAKAIIKAYECISLADIKDLVGDEDTRFHDNRIFWADTNKWFTRWVTDSHIEIVLYDGRFIPNEDKPIDRSDTNETYLSAEGIYRHIIHKPFLKNKTFIITGKGGPTGKTWLCNKLKANGFKAIELTEEMSDACVFNGQKNYYICDDNRDVTMIILNKPLNLKRKTMTVEEIEKELGYKIEIISEDK